MRAALFGLIVLSASACSRAPESDPPPPVPKSVTVSLVPTIAPPAPAAGELTWDAPAAWAKAWSPSPMRKATYTIPKAADDKDNGELTVTDRMSGAGRHALRWHFHLAPGVDVDPLADGGLALSTASGRWHFRADPALTRDIAEAWYSPSYGVRIACRALDFNVSADVSAGPAFVFSIGRASLT